MIVPKGEEQTSINGEMLNSCSSPGWQVLNFLEEVETSGTFFDKNKTELTEFTSHPLFLVISLLKVVQKSFVIFNHRTLTYRSFNSLLFSKFPYDMRNCYLTILSIKYKVTKATLHPLKRRPFFTLFSCNSKTNPSSQSLYCNQHIKICKLYGQWNNLTQLVSFYLFCSFVFCFT